MVEGFSRHWTQFSSIDDPNGQANSYRPVAARLGLTPQTPDPRHITLEEPDEFTAEHEQFRKVVRSFIESEINPYVDEWEEARIFPGARVVPKLAEIGAFGLEYDEQYGGQGADHSYTFGPHGGVGYSTHCAGARWPLRCSRTWRHRRCIDSGRTS